MSPWKILLLPLGVLLTALAYVATSLVGTAARPEVPEPIVLERSGEVVEPTDEPDEPDEVVVVTPRPTAVRDDDGGAGDETDDSQDESDDTNDDSEAGDD